MTVHVHRLCVWLRRRALPFEFADISSLGTLRVLLAIRRHRVAHLHGTNPFFLLLVCGWSKVVGTSAILTYHGDLDSVRGLQAAVLRAAIRLSKVPIMLNAQSYEAVRTVNPAVQLISAFIPPVTEEAPDPKVVREIRRRAEMGSPVVVTYAYDLAFDVHGRETYGITDVVTFFADKGCLLVVSDPSGNYSKFLRERMQPPHLAHTLFVTGPHSLYGLLTCADMFVRNTTTDGDALSIHEALHLRKQVWATGCVGRPQGVRTYADLGEIRFDQSEEWVYAPPAVVDDLVRLYQTL